MAEWDSYFRAANEQTGTPAKRSVVNEPRGPPPIAEGTNRRSGGRKYLPALNRTALSQGLKKVDRTSKGGWLRKDAPYKYRIRSSEKPPGLD